MSDMFRSNVSPIRDFAQEEAERRHMNETYCIIYCSEDGDTSLQMVTRETLLERLNEDYYGKMPVFELKNGQHVNCGDVAGIYIIKGVSVIPQPKKVVTEWDI